MSNAFPSEQELKDLELWIDLQEIESFLRRLISEETEQEKEIFAPCSSDSESPHLARYLREDEVRAYARRYWRDYAL